MAESNVGRQLGFIFLATIVLGGGFVAYMLHQIKRPVGPALVASPPSAFSQMDARAESVKKVAAIFVQHLSSSQHEDAYRQMASAYRKTTSIEAFRAACQGSPFLSTVRNVSLPRTRETIAPGETQGAMTASGVMTTGAGSVEVVFSFVDDDVGPAIVNLTVAGTPALPMGTLPAPSAKPAIAPRRK
jgi:hypothetical protein